MWFLKHRYHRIQQLSTGDDFAPRGAIWKCLEKCSVVTKGEECHWYPVGRGQYVVNHCTRHRTAPQQRIMTHNVLRSRNSDLIQHVSRGSHDPERQGDLPRFTHQQLVDDIPRSLLQRFLPDLKASQPEGCLP